MNKLAKIDETKKFEIITKEHSELDNLIKNEKGSRIGEADPTRVLTFLTVLVGKCFLLAGLKKLNKEDLLITTTSLQEDINEKYPSLTNFEIEKAFRNGISHEYKDRGNYNFALSFGTFMFFLGCYNEDKKKLKNSHVAKNRETQKEKKIQLDLRKIAQEKHDKFFSEKFDNFLNECENILIEGMILNFSVLDDSEIIGLTPFLQKECKKLNCMINDEQKKTIEKWVSEFTDLNVNYRYRVEFEVLVLNLFRKAMNIPEDKYFVLFTKPNKE